MRKILLPGAIGLVMLILAACGSAATAVPAATQAPAAPAAPAAAAKPAAPAAVAAPGVSPALAAYAAKYAGGPGAIYAGDLKQLVGPAPTKAQGDAEGNVPLDSLKRHLYVYQSDYYQSLLQKAKLTNPTPLVSTGKSITIQHVCIARTLLPCVQMANYFGPNLLARTNGQLKLEISSFPELGLAGPDTLNLVADGTLAMADIYSGFVSGTFPAIEIQNLWGLYPDRETEFRATVAIAGDLEKLVSDVTGGAKVINYNWFAGADQFLFCNKPLRTLDDYKGLKTRSHGSTMTDWIVGMGGEAQFVGFSEVYTALERGILDCGVTGGDPGYGQRWYEVVKYMNGPLVSFFTINNVMNKGVWDKLPADLQQIMIEEGAKSELEALRIASIQNEVGILKNTTAGMEFVEFSSELRGRSNATVVNRVVPNWIKRAGGADKPIVKVFNEKIGPLVGLHVEANGTVTKVAASAAKAAPAAEAVPVYKLAAYAAQYSGKPGAIYVGDLTQLVGPAPQKDLGGLDGDVPLEALQTHQYIYDGPYYQSLLKKANLDNPTKLVTTGAKFTLQHACINRTLGQCKIIESFWKPNIEARTKGQLKLEITSFPELGIAGPDTLRLVQDGTLSMAEIYTGYVAGDLPEIEIQSLWGLAPDQKSMYLANSALHPDVEKLVTDATGATVVAHIWVPGVDNYLWSKKPLKTLDDFKGVKTRSHSSAMTDWIAGMGAEPQFVAFSEVYTALERGILGAGVSGAGPAYGQRWHEVTKYINGPMPAELSVNIVVNRKEWDKLPADLQQILIEEGARTELEGLRLMSIQDTVEFERNVLAGLEFVEFSKELKDHSLNVAVMQRVIPNWVKRVGGPDKPIIKTFNEKVGPLVGLRIEPNGSVVKISIIKVN